MATKKYHRLTDDDGKIACRPQTPPGRLFAGRTYAYASAFISRHPDVRLCKMCWPDVATLD